MLVAICRMIGFLGIQIFSIYSIAHKKTSIDVINAYMVGFLVMKIEIIMSSASAAFTFIKNEKEIKFKRTHTI